MVLNISALFSHVFKYFHVVLCLSDATQLVTLPNVKFSTRCSVARAALIISITYKRNHLEILSSEKSTSWMSKWTSEPIGRIIEKCLIQIVRLHVLTFRKYFNDFAYTHTQHTGWLTCEMKWTSNRNKCDSLAQATFRTTYDNGKSHKINNDKRIPNTFTEACRASFIYSFLSTYFFPYIIHNLSLCTSVHELHVSLDKQLTLCRQ